MANYHLCFVLPDVDCCGDIGFLARPRQEQHARSSAWHRIQQFLFFSYTKKLRVTERGRVKLLRVLPSILSSSVSDLDPEWIRIGSGLNQVSGYVFGSGIRFRIQDSKNDPQKNTAFRMLSGLGYPMRITDYALEPQI